MTTMQLEKALAFRQNTLSGGPEAKVFEKHDVKKSKPALRIIPLSYRHIDAVARLHREAIPAAFTSFLGESFLKIFYRTLIESRYCFGFSAVDENDNVLGYITGASRLSGFSRDFLMRNFLTVPFLILPKVLSWKIVKSIFQSLFMSRQDRKKDLPEAEIVSVAVVPQARGMGIGKRLMNVALDEFVRHGVQQVKVMVGDKLPANQYYIKSGFEWVEHLEFGSKKGSANVYVKKLRASPKTRLLADRCSPKCFVPQVGLAKRIA
jgi:ribosomal protein S18 acetylase RimI-like enzyme